MGCRQELVCDNCFVSENEIFLLNRTLSTRKTSYVYACSPRVHGGVAAVDRLQHHSLVVVIAGHRATTAVHIVECAPATTAAGRATSTSTGSERGAMVTVRSVRIHEFIAATAAARVEYGLRLGLGLYVGLKWKRVGEIMRPCRPGVGMITRIRVSCAVGINFNHLLL